MSGIKDLADIIEVLHDLTKEQYTKLGLQLGLYLPTLEGIDAPTTAMYGVRVLEAWLNQKDSVVERRGIPTCNSLIGALRVPSVDLKVHAEKIKKEFSRISY